MTQARTGSDDVASVEGAAEGPATGPRPWALGVLGLVTAAVVGLDVFTKQLALTNLSDGSVVRLFNGAVYLDLTRNSGAAFSFGAKFTIIFPLFGIVVMVVIGYLARRLRSLPWALALGLILGGALGNFIDRLFRAPGPLRGHVVDFISVFAPGGETFPIFNTADSALCVGVALLILLEFTGRRRDGTRQRTGSSAQPNR